MISVIFLLLKNLYQILVRSPNFLNSRSRTLAFVEGKIYPLKHWEKKMARLNFQLVAFNLG